MPYKKMYLHLFNAVTDAIREIEYGTAEKALNRLKLAQEETEELYCACEENSLDKEEIILDNRGEKC